MSVVNNLFYGTTSLTKTGSTGNYNYGNGFHGPTTLTQSSSTAGLYWSNSGRDTSFAALTLVCSGSQPHTIANAYDFIVMGDLTVNRTGSGALTLAASNLIGKTRFEGGANQTFTSTGSAAALCYKATVNKSTGTLTLASDLEVNNDITLTAGIVKTTGSAVLKLRDNATATSASDASHVEGRVLKVGNDAFTFPVGRNGAYRPIAISAPSSTSAEFRGEYLENNSDWVHSHGSKDGTIAQISRNEYWNLDRLVSTNTVSVTLKWDTATSCTFDTLANLRVVAWDGSTWKDKGNGGTTGNVNVGTVVTNGASSTYGMYALGTKDGFECISSAPGLPEGTVTDSLDRPMYMRDQFIVRFHPRYVKAAAVNNRNAISGDLSYFLEDELLDTLEQVLPSDLTRYRLSKIYKSMSTNDTTMVTNLNETIRLPKSWSGFLMAVPQTDDQLGVMAELDSLFPYVLYAHPNWNIELTGTPCFENNYDDQVPDDPRFPDSWHLDPDPALAFATETPLVGINVLPAWEIENGKPHVRVGVFDTGIKGSHPDFQYTSGGTMLSVVKGGFDYVGGQILDTDYYSDPDYEGHGTSVAGIIGARRYNNKAISGIAGGNQENAGVSLYACKIYPFNAAPNIVGALDAINMSPDDPSLSNMSFGITIGAHPWRLSNSTLPLYNTEDNVRELKDATYFSFRKKVVSVFSRGNEGLTSEPDELAYPACFNDPWIISVGGTGKDGGYMSRSNTNSIGVGGLASDYTPSIGENLDLAAPAHKIYTLKASTDETYDNFSYTSAATPQVAGVAALLLSKWNLDVPDEQNLAPEDVEFILQATATDAMTSAEVLDGTGLDINEINIPGYDDYIGWGRLNAGEALKLVNAPEFDVRHFNPIGELADIETEVPVTIPEDVNIDIAEDVNGNAILAGDYTADVYHYSTTMNGGTLTEGQYIFESTDGYHRGLWPRHSSVNLMPARNSISNHLENFPELTQDGDELHGYIYKIYDPNNPTQVLAWLPYDPTATGAPDPVMPYTALVHDWNYAECTHNNSEEVIATDTEWTGDHSPCGDLRVMEGATFTITGNVFFNPNAKLIVERGAKLVIDGGLLTTYCPDENWQGIYVWGTPTAPVSLSVGGPHGVVEMVNGATIENAVVGIRASKEGDCCNWSGGIVRAIGNGPDDRVTFRNCRKAVELMRYVPNGNDVGSASEFKFCNFVCDAPMRHPSFVLNGQPLGVNSFVTVWDQRGVTFSHCDFTNTYIDTEQFPQHLRGWGIGMVDAHITVNYCRFTGLTNGVNSRKTFMNNSRLLKVENCTFTNTMMGVLTENSVLDKVFTSTFEVPHRYLFAPAFGVNMFNAFNGKVKGNTMTSLYGTSGSDARGIINRGRNKWDYAGGLVYDNDIYAIMVGSQTEMHNPALRILCNRYVSLYEWAINLPSSGTAGYFLGPQGTGCHPTLNYRAGNEFYHESGTNIWSWAQPFKYWGKANSSGNPITYPNANSQAQQDLIFWCDNGPDDSCERIEELEPEFEHVRMMMDSTIGVLEAERASALAALDSNLTKTTTLLAHIADAGYNDTLLRNELLLWGPLSDTVLRSLCERDPVFTPDFLTEVLITNSPVTRQVWPYMVAVLDSISSTLADSIAAAQANDTTRTVGAIDYDLESSQSERFAAIMGRLEQLTDVDHTLDSVPLAINYLWARGDLEFKRLAVGCALGLDSLELARGLLDSLPLATKEDSTFYDYHDILISLREDSKTILDLKGSELDPVHDLAYGESSLNALAEAVLALHADSAIIRWHEELPEERRGQHSQSDQLATTEFRQEVSVFPNPALNTFTVNYQLEREVGLLVAEIYDVAGRKVAVKNATATQKGQLLIDLTPCSGVYFIRLVADGNSIHNTKLICFDRK